MANKSDKPTNKLSFSQTFSKLDKEAWNSTGKGHLQNRCSISVHDYGMLLEERKCDIKGSHNSIFYHSENELKEVHKDFFETKPEWCNRWIGIFNFRSSVKFYFHA